MRNYRINEVRSVLRAERSGAKEKAERGSERVTRHEVQRGIEKEGNDSGIWRNGTEGVDDNSTIRHGTIRYDTPRRSGTETTMKTRGREKENEGENDEKAESET